MQFLNNSEIKINLPNGKKQTIVMTEQKISELNEIASNNVGE
jgi:hypothetical protein